VRARGWLVVLLLIVAAGCGGDGDDGGGGGVTTTETTPESSADVDGMVGEATYVEEGKDEEVLAGEAPITPEPQKQGGRGMPRCTDDTLPITEATRARAEAAAVCVINKVRRRSARRALKSSGQLYQAASAHANDMVQEQYFAHVSKAGATVGDRVKPTGYLSGRSWTLGENIAWGSGSLSTPTAIVQGWLNSPGHRQNLMRRSYREAGLAIVVGAPQGATGEAGTYAHVFGRHR
jgi:uncharacterized protein YkwD